MPSLRFTLDQMVPFIRIDYTAKDPSSKNPNYCLWTDKLNSIHFSMMQCTEKNRIPNEWNGGPERIDYVFKDEDNRYWGNSCNCTVCTNMKASCQGYVFLREDTSSAPSLKNTNRMEALDNYVFRLMVGIRNLKEVESWSAAKLKTHLDDVLNAAREQLGIDVTLTQHHPEFPQLMDFSYQPIVN